MNQSPRHQRLLTDLDGLRQLKQQSSIFDFQFEGELPDRYTIMLHGRGIGGEPRGDDAIPWADLHRIELRLPYSYPDRPPDIRWQTPLFHPNVSFSGFINLTDLGLPWDDACALDMICERLWDVARLAYLDLEQATNYAARGWYKGHPELALPVDIRPLRSPPGEPGSNILRYERRRGKRSSPASDAPDPADIFYIDENTPVPDLPLATSRRRGSDDEVFFIGEE